MGDAFILVSPGNIWVYIADPDAVTDIWRRGKEFPRDTSVTGMTVVPGSHRCPCREAVVHLRKHLIRYSNPRHIRSKYLHGKQCPLLSSLAFPCEPNDDGFRHKARSGLNTAGSRLHRSMIRTTLLCGRKALLWPTMFFATGLQKRLSQPVLTICEAYLFMSCQGLGLEDRLHSKPRRKGMQQQQPLPTCP